MPLQVIGQIFNFAASKSADEDVALAESEGPFVFADARDAARWTGMGWGGRWKTWVLGDLAGFPINWPKFTRFNETREEALENYQKLRRAIEAGVPGGPIRRLQHPLDAQGALFEGVFPQQGEGGPLGVLMLAPCTDYDFAVHVTRGLGLVRGGNHDGPLMISYRPPPAPCAIATCKGINDRIDHIVVVFSPGPDDQRAFIEGGLRGAGPDGQHDDCSIDAMSGVVTIFWSRIAGASMLHPYGADAAMGLCNAGLVASGGACAIEENVGDGFESRRAGSGAWAFLVNPGRWTGRYWYTDTADGAGLSCCIFSRDGSEPFNPDLPCGFPTPQNLPPPPPTVGQAWSAGIGQVAKNMAKDEARRMVTPYLPSTLFRQFMDKVKERLWLAITGCVTTVLAVLLIGGILAIVAIAVAVKAMM